MAKQKEQDKPIEKQKDLEEALQEIQQRFGEGAIMQLSGIRKVAVDSVSTGSIALDSALGVGGVPRGRIIEIYGAESTGKSTLSLHILAEAQKKGGTCAFIDAEHAMDPDYAKKIGVDISTLLISQPDSGEQALQIVETLVRSKAVEVIVVDSVAALTPKAEIEGEIGDVHIGRQARLMSQALRKLASIVSETKTIVIFLNQTRMKIGVVFGCFSYDSKITLADGSKKNIGKIVNQKIPAEVLSYNFEKKRIESQSIIDWHVNGDTDSFLQFFIQNHTGNGRRGFSCTPDHKIHTPYGWKKAKELKIGDEINVRVNNEKITPVQEQLLLGSILGDGNLKKKQEQNAYFREEHSPKQATYLHWLASVLGNLVSSISLRTAQDEVLVSSRHLLYFGDLFTAFYPKSKKIVPKGIVDRVGALALATWYCGYGSLQTGTSWWKGKEYKHRPRATLYTNGFDDTKSQSCIERIFQRFDIQVSWRKVKNSRAVQFSVAESVKFFDLVSPYVPPSMWYKLPVSHHGRYQEISPQKTKKDHIIRPMKIKKIKKRIPYKDGRRISRYRFDITVAKNHNYFVDGCLVSNSPITTPGGMALKFYSSVRLQLSRVAQIKKVDQIIGSRIRAKVVKNKVAAPFKSVEFDIYWNEGISKAADIVNTGLKYGVVKKSGSWFQYKDTKLGQGIDGAKNFLKENKPVATEIKKDITEAMKQENLTNE